MKPIRNIKKLIDINLSDNEIHDLAPLSDMTQLTSLNMEKNYITDVSALKELTNLTRLYLSENKINDIRPLQSLYPKAYMVIQRQKINLNKATVNENMSLSIYNYNGSLPTNITVKNEEGTYKNGSIKWHAPGKKSFEFEESNDRVYFHGFVTQNVLEKQEGSKKQSSNT